MSINFISHKGYGKFNQQCQLILFLIKDHTMHAKSDDIKNIMSSETDETIEELFKPLLRRYQEG